MKKLGLILRGGVGAAKVVGLGVDKVGSQARTYKGFTAEKRLIICRETATNNRILEKNRNVPFFSFSKILLLNPCMFPLLDIS